MVHLLALIGSCWIFKILLQTGVLTMNKQKILETVAKVRNVIPGHPRNYNTSTTNRLHKMLDEVVSAVGEPEEVLEKSERSLEEHIIAHLLLREKEKKVKTLSEKAKVVISSLDE